MPDDDTTVSPPLLGSDRINSTVTIGDTEVQLADIVAKAHADSGLTADEWNEQSDEDRDLALEVAIEALREAAATVLPGDENDALEPVDLEPAEEAKDTVRVTLTAFSHSDGVRLSVNGRRFHLPLNQPVDLPAWALPALESVGGAIFTRE